MRTTRGQVSAEFAMMLAVQLLIIALLAAIFSGVVAQASLRTQQILARDSVLSVADAAQAAWAGGPGTLKTASIAIPENAVLDQNGAAKHYAQNLSNCLANSSLNSSSYIANYTLNLNLLSFGDISTYVPFCIHGYWPPSSGTQLMSAYNNGSAVLIRPTAYVEFNTSVAYFSINKTVSSTENINVRIRNNMPITYNVTPSVQSCSGLFTCTIIPYQVYEIPQNGYQDFIVRANVAAKSAGLYSGMMNFTIIPSDASYPKSNFTLPISVRVYP